MLPKSRPGSTVFLKSLSVLCNIQRLLPPPPPQAAGHRQTDGRMLPKPLFRSNHLKLEIQLCNIPRLPPLQAARHRQDDAGQGAGP